MNDAFELQNGVLVALYKRTKETSPETAVRTLREIQAHEPARPGSQKDWIDIGPSDAVNIDWHAGGSTEITIQPREDGKLISTTLLYIGPSGGSAEGQVTMNAVSSSCRGRHVQVLMADPSGKIAPLMPRAAIIAAPALIHAPPASVGYLLLLLELTGEREVLTGCSINLNLARQETLRADTDAANSR